MLKYCTEPPLSCYIFRCVCVQAQLPTMGRSSESTAGRLITFGYAAVSPCLRDMLYAACGICFSICGVSIGLPQHHAWKALGMMPFSNTGL